MSAPPPRSARAAAGPGPAGASARTALTNQRILEALRATLGKVYLAAERLGCTSGQILARARRSRRIADALEHYRGRLVDAAEAALWQQVTHGQSWAVSLVLKTLGRSRGYGDAEPQPDEEQPAATTSLQSVLAELLHDPNYLEFCRARAQAEACFARPANTTSSQPAVGRPDGEMPVDPARAAGGDAGLPGHGHQPGPLETGAPPVGH